MKNKRFVIKAIIFGLLCICVGVLLPLFIPGLTEKYRFWQKTYRLRRAIAADPSALEHYNSLLFEYYTHGPDYVDEIIAIEEKIVELRPDEPQACLSLAQALLRLETESKAEYEGRNKKILNLVEKAISLSSEKDIFTYSRAGTILSQIGEVDEARKYLEHALSHFKGDTAMIEVISRPYKMQIEETLKNLGEKERIVDSLKQLMLP